MHERAEMLKKVQTFDFCAHEAALYLNNHPDNKSALAYFNRYLQLARRAAAEYEERFGPLSHQNHDESNRWRWADGPWPWEVDD
ncbi:MAG: spore coat protein CotJB [Clostridiales bacterium]|nr:spore coat protein CotJB [Clostridiales bacterium]